MNDEGDSSHTPDLGRRTFCTSMGAGAVACTLASRPMFAAVAAHADSKDLTLLTLSEASTKLRSGAITSVQLTQAYLERISRYNPTLNAFVTVMHKQALTQARRLDAEAVAGHFRSPLHGVPLVLKDNIDTAGVLTTAASAIFADRVPTEDAEVVRRLRDAGAVIVGKANLHEFCLGATAATSYFGPVHNPWALERVSGGSSGGSGAAVAAQLCCGALGTDTAGSVRVPAAYCGVVGLKPTHGLVSNQGIIPCVPSLDTCGPIARTVEDAALLLEHMVGYDAGDSASIDRPKEQYTALMRQPVSGLRVGLPRASFFEHLDADIAKCVEEAIVVLGTLVMSVGNVVLPTTAVALFPSIAFAEFETYHRPYLQHHADLYRPGTLRLLQAGEQYLNDPSTGTSAAHVADYVQARWDMERARRKIDSVFADFDVVALPTMRTLPPTVQDALQQEAAPGADNPGLSLENCVIFNLLGLPAISVPCGFSASGLPIGLMIAGPHFTEGKLLALAHAYEQATEWHQRKPAVIAQSSARPDGVS
jgi:aspartyl-tRNA(Asn)/glutamyl-tRNA(Gln) amidotransferase subunit A